jgi:uncharacterized membrane protein YfcA
MLVAALVVGMLIGCVGIGGVLLTPALVYVGGLGFHLAAATSMWAFLFAGAAGTSIYSKHGSIDWRLAAWLGTGVVPAAFAGAWANAALPEGVLMALLATLMVVTGADALLRGQVVEQEARRFGATALLARRRPRRFRLRAHGHRRGRVARTDPNALAGASAGVGGRRPGRRAAGGSLLHRGLRPVRLR